jgi:phage terminase large subunit-like protein
VTTATQERPRTKRQPPAPPLDPTTQYARDVVDGRIVAGRAVRQACQRHLTDLGRQRTDAFPYYFDVAAAQHIIDFFPTFLPLESGEPFVLPPWLQFCYGNIYGWKAWGGDRHGLRKYQHGFFETSKGSGKTPSAGGVAIYGAAYDDEPHAEIYSTGFDKGQASIILNDAIRMVNDSPDEDFRREFIADKYNIAHPPSGSFVRAMSSQHRSKSGPRPHYVLSDEIHEHRDGTVVAKAESGFKNRLQPLGLKYTNSGSDKTSYCWELHQKSLAILDGTLVDEQWFAYVCHLDPCEQHYEEGYRQPKDGCERCDNWRDPAVWPKIAPALGIVIQPKYLQDAIDVADSIPSQYALVRRLNFCIWTETHQVWISSAHIEACKVEALSATPAAACAFAFDMSDKLDLTAGVAALRIDDAPGVTADTAEIIEVEGEKEITKTLELNFCVDLVPYFWIPEETLIARVRTEHLPYDVWRRIPGVLRVTPGPIVDHDKIYEEYKNEIQPRHKATVTGYDQHHATQFGAALRDKAKLNAVEVPQGRKLSEAFKWFEALVRARRIRHLGNPIFMWNVANCEVQSDRFRNIWVEKPTNTTKRIDGAVAAVMALSLLMAMPREKQFQAFIFGGGGKR